MLTGHHYQNAYVTRDLDKWVAEFEARTDVRQMITYEGATPVWTPAGDGVQTCKLALIWVGDLQYELIQPISGAVEMYAEALPDNDGLQFHHICNRVADWDSFRAAIEKEPFPIVLEGGSDALKFIYVDARPFLGHFIEYTWMTDERWGQMGGL